MLLSAAIQGVRRVTVGSGGARLHRGQALVGHERCLRGHAVGKVVQLLGLGLDGGVLAQAILVLGGNLSALVLELHAPIARGRDHGRRLYGGIDEIQLQAPLAHPAGLSTVLAVGLALVTLQMPLPTGQTAGADSLGLALGIGGRGTIVALGPGVGASHQRGTTSAAGLDFDSFDRSRRALLAGRRRRRGQRGEELGRQGVDVGGTGRGNE